MANERPNCKECRYRYWLAKYADCHVWWQNCEHCGDELCEKMNDPGFIKWMGERKDNG